ncbi:hypothetical protein, partial [Campylobacter lari]|uniref:hypothetical protein n=1 Tax=Campylobacter lari TaxID=201 RepID=UPI001C7D3366
MKKLKENEVLLLFGSILQDIQNENQHLTPTINDVYDFCNYILKPNIIERNDKNSEIIIKNLKHLTSKDINRNTFLGNIIQEF